MNIKRLKNKIILNLIFSEENKIFTHLTDEEKLTLYRIAKESEGDVFLEIGSYVGASSCFIGSGISRTKPDAKLYCVDTWMNDAMTEGGKNTYDSFLKNTHKYAQKIIPMRGESESIAKSFDQKIDFLFFDGDHSYKGILKDWHAWKPKLNPNAIVAFHDIGWAVGVQKVINEHVQSLLQWEKKLPNFFWGQIK